MSVAQCLVRKKPDPVATGVDSPWKQSYDNEQGTSYQYPTQFGYWNAACTAIDAYSSTQDQWKVSAGIFPDNVASGENCHTYHGGANCEQCYVRKWNPAMKAACCNASQEEMTAGQCDANWCRFSDQCVAETKTWCAAPVSDTDTTKRFEVTNSDTSKDCSYGSNWQKAFPTDWDAMVTPFCSDPVNLNRPVCKEFCKRADVNCNDVQRKYTQQNWAIAVTPTAKTAVINDPLSACWMDTVQPGWYDNLYRSQTSLVNGLPVPKNPICVHGTCDTSPYKPFADKNVAAGDRCPPVTQCIAINDIQNDGTVGNVTFNNNINCNFNTNPFQCSSDQYVDQQDCTPCPPTQTCAPCINGKRGACTTCPPGQTPKADRSGCEVGTNATGPSSSGPSGSTGSTGSTGSFGSVSFNKMWTSLRKWINTHPDASVLAGTVIVSVILASLLWTTKPKPKRRPGINNHIYSQTNMTWPRSRSMSRQSLMPNANAMQSPPMNAFMRRL
jgi:hypothetical protein